MIRSAVPGRGREHSVPMTLMELPDYQAALLQAQAHARGLTIVEWIAELAARTEPESAEPADERPTWEVIADSMKDIPPEVMATMPRDGASQHDHYIYGWPKRDDGNHR